MTETTPSRDLQIQTPCPKTWSELVGGDRTRYCSACDLHVHNSESLTREDAHQLASDSSARVCMRIVQDESGAPVYLDTKDEDSSTPSRIHQFARWALATSAGLLAACRAEAPVDPHLPADPPTGELRATLGEICPPDASDEPEAREILGKLEAVEEPCDGSSPTRHATVGRVSVGTITDMSHEDPE